MFSLYKTLNYCMILPNFRKLIRIPISLSDVSLNPSYKLVMPSKPRGAAAEPVAIDSEAAQPLNTLSLPTPSTEGMHKEIEEYWTSMIKGLKISIEKELEGPRRENRMACLQFVRENGYSEGRYCVWAVDGVARCMDVFDFVDIANNNLEHMRHAFSCVSCASMSTYFQRSSILTSTRSALALGWIEFCPPLLPPS